MDNQHREITGYRELSQDDIDSMNAIKEAVENLREVLEWHRPLERVDGRCLALAVTKLDECSMWACRGVAKPSAG